MERRGFRRSRALVQNFYALSMPTIEGKEAIMPSFNPFQILYRLFLILLSLLTPGYGRVLI